MLDYPLSRQKLFLCSRKNRGINTPPEYCTYLRLHHESFGDMGMEIQRTEKYLYYEKLDNFIPKGRHNSLS